MIDGKKSGQNVAKIKGNRVKRVQKRIFPPAARFFAKRVIYSSLLVKKCRAKRGEIFWGKKFYPCEKPIKKRWLERVHVRSMSGQMEIMASTQQMQTATEHTIHGRIQENAVLGVS